MLYSFLLTMKIVNLVVVRDGFCCIMESLIVHIFHRDYVTLITEVLFTKLLICTAVWRSGCFTFQKIINGCSTNNCGVQYSHSGYILWLQRCILNSSQFVLLCNRLNIAVKDA